MPPEGLESSVDGLGRPVRAVGVVEEREDVRHAAFEGASERDESGASGRRSVLLQCLFDRFGSVFP